MKEKKIFNKQFIFKLYFFGFIICISLVGCFLGFIFSELENNFPLYFQNSIITTILLVIITILVSISIHELSHLLKFISMGYNIRLFVLGPLSFYKKSNKWKAKFKFNSALGIGGLVFPNITQLKNEKEFKKTRTDYSKAMIIAPVISAIQGILSLCFIIFLLPKLSSNVQSTFFTIFITSFFTTLYINIASLINISGILGDYVAYKSFKYNDAFSAYQLYTYAILSTKKQTIRNNCNIVKQIMLSYLDEKYKSKDLDQFTCLLIDTFLYEYLSHGIAIHEIVLKYIYYFIDNIDTYYSKLMYESHFILTIHIVLYLSENDLEKSINLWNHVKNKIPKNKVGKYYINQVNNKFNNTTSSTFICDKNSITLSSLDPILNVLDNYYDDEIKLISILY